MLQRVSEARVVVDGATVGAIGRGLLVLVCAERGDGDEQARRLLARLLTYRVFPDEAGRMNRSLSQLAQEARGTQDAREPQDAGEAREAPGEAGLLLVPQFTLAADTRSGTRPGFSPAAEPEEGRRLFALLAEEARREHPTVETGIFGADMKVHLVNDGPVTFWLRADPPMQEAKR
nr:D-aminoacyl-tRNA deacylase [Quisquiliibacterium transsilvanicum]